MSMGWQEAALDDVLAFSSGKAIEVDATGNYPVFGSNGLIGRSGRSLFTSGVVIGRVGAYCGSIALSSSPFWASDNTIVARPKGDAIDLRFAYYLLKNAALNRHAGGSAQPLLTQTVLKPLRFRLPLLQVQQRIASILGAYDDLIEVNQRRIALLEEMARRLFEHAISPAVRTVSGETPVAELIEWTLGGDWGAEVETDGEKCGVRVIRGTDLRQLADGEFGTVPERFVSQRSADRRRLKPFDLVVENSSTRRRARQALLCWSHQALSPC
jgi:type I restriction enzyme S subunit